MPANRVTIEISYTGGNGKSYSGFTVNSTGVAGLSATLGAGVFEIGNGTLTITLSGTASVTGDANFSFTIAGINCSVTVLVNPLTTVVCNPLNPTAIVDVTNPATGKTWMDRNLGANRVATVRNDPQAYGSLYQWGRFSDGHQCVNRYPEDGITTSGTTSNNANTAVPFAGNLWDGFFITENSTPFDWLVPQNANLWQGVNGAFNPCPSGYRLPTQAELDAEIASWSSNNSNGAFASPLKLPVAGYRDSNGTLTVVGSVGRYWTSTVSILNSIGTFISGSTAFTNTYSRNLGYSVRCIKN